MQGGGINGFCCYLDIIVSPNKLTSSIQRSQPFSNYYYNNNDKYFLQTFIEALCIRQKITCECYGRIGHKADTCIICGPKFLPYIIRQNMNKLNALRGDKPAETPR